MSQDRQSRRVWDEHDGLSNEWEQRSRFQTASGGSILHDHAGRNDSTLPRTSPVKPSHSFPSQNPDRSRLQHEFHLPSESARGLEQDQMRPPSPRRYRALTMHPGLPETAHSPEMSRVPRSPKYPDGHRVDGHREHARPPPPRHSTAFHPYSPAEYHGSAGSGSESARDVDGHGKDGPIPTMKQAGGGAAFKGGHSGRVELDGSIKGEWDEVRRLSSKSHSPLKPIFTADETLNRHFRTGRRERDGGRRSASPVSTFASHPLSSGMSTIRNYRPSTGEVPSFFNRAPTQPRGSNRENAFSSPPTSTQPIDDNRHPAGPPPIAHPRAPSPSRQRSAGRAWFAPGPPGYHPDATKWPSDHLRAYDAGYDDAMRSVENGIFGVDGVQYRDPILVNPVDSVAPPQSYLREVDDRRSGGPIPTPLASHPPSIDHHRSQAQFAYFDGPSAAYHPSSALVSPYGHPMQPLPHTRVYPRPDFPFDPYHAMAHPLYAYGQMPYPRPSRSTRQLISCYPCRNRKLKCDGSKPCAQCIRRGSEADCAYATHVRRRGKGRKVGEGEGSSGEEGSGTGQQEKGGSVDSLETPRSGWDGARDLTAEEERSREPSIVLVENQERADVNPPTPPVPVPDGKAEDTHMDRA